MFSAELFLFSKAPAFIVQRESCVHTHETEEEEHIRRSTIEKMKIRILEEPEKSVKRVYTEVLSSSIAELRRYLDEEEIGVSMPRFDAVSSMLQQTRNKIRPPLPESRAQIELNEAWTHTGNGREFLCIDNGTSDRILDFATEEMLRTLCSADTVYMDGTFRVVPHLFG